MTTVTENDLKELKDLIISQNQKIDKLSDKIDQKIDNLADKIDQKIDKLTDVINNLAISQAEIKGEINALSENLNGKITTLNETIKGVDKRLDSIEILNRIIFGAVIGSVFVGLIKYLFFSNPHI